MTRVNLIYARSANGVIGKNNTLPWHIPDDMAHFRAMTSGAPVIMGRRTWDSLPPRFRPLPKRVNIVVTRQADWAADGAMRASDLRDAVALATRTGAPDVWVIGGAQIYAEAAPLAQRAVVTEIEQDFDGDAFAPVLDTDWRETSRVPHVSADGMRFNFVTYER